MSARGKNVNLSSLSLSGWILAARVALNKGKGGERERERGPQKMEEESIHGLEEGATLKVQYLHYHYL